MTHGIAQAVFNFTLVANRGHIDKVDNDQTAEVTQAQLASYLVCRFQVGVERSFFDIAAAGCTRGVDVDSGQRFGRVDNDRTAGRQANFTLEGGFDLRFDLVVAEQRDFTAVQFDFAAEIRTAQGSDVLFGQIENFWIVDQDFADVRAQIVAECTYDDVAFLMDQEGRSAAFSGFFNRFPVLQAEREIPLQCIGRFANACGTNNQTHAIRELQRRKRFFQFSAVITFDAA